MVGNMVGNIVTLKLASRLIPKGKRNGKTGRK